MLGEALLFAAVLLVGLLIRLRSIEAEPFWVDEAESSINALTILEKGYPGDEYLGLPIYENSLTRPWPENPEYAYRDVSYSDSHFAIYHGWLPLYAIAGSFALAKIEPASPDVPRSIQYSLAERKRRTRAARLPAALFGVLFLIVVFAGGCALYGRDAGWAALVMGTIHPYHLEISHQARYYSAQVALATACSVSLWLLLKHAKWKHVLLAAFSFVLLFYTHLLSFCTAAAVSLLVTPFVLRRHPDGFLKLAAFASLVAAGTLPWILTTGFYSHQARIPRAWPFLELPGDFWLYPPFHWSAALIGVTLAILFAVLILARLHLPKRFFAPALRLRAPLAFLCCWAICGYAIFFLCMPLVSFDRGRLNLSYWGPALLLAAILCAALGRTLASRRFSTVLAPAILLLTFFATGHTLQFWKPFAGRSWAADSGVLDYLAFLHLDRNTKLYAAPNDHLILTFYSGLPVQDMTPVKKSFLDSYPGGILYIERGISVDTDVLTAAKVRSAALRHGISLSPAASEQWSEKLRMDDYRTDILKLAPAALPPFACELLAEHHRRLPELFNHSGLELMTRGFPLRSWADWRNVLKYRFIDPKAHSGARANYTERLRGAEVTILSHYDTAIYRSPGIPDVTHSNRIVIFH